MVDNVDAKKTLSRVHMDIGIFYWVNTNGDFDDRVNDLCLDESEI
jgi:hypothetical protein